MTYVWGAIAVAIAMMGAELWSLAQRDRDIARAGAQAQRDES